MILAFARKFGAGLTMATPVVFVLGFWIENTSARPQVFAASVLLLAVGQLMAHIRID